MSSYRVWLTHEVGSSRKSTDGRASNSIPIDNRLLSPPEMPLLSSFPILVPATSFKPNNPRTSSTLAALSRSETLSGSLSRAANRSASRTVEVAGRTSDWSTNAMETELVGDPGRAIWRVPEILPALRCPDKMSINVLQAPSQLLYRTCDHATHLLPAPEGPRMAIIVPGSTLPLKPSSKTFRLVASLLNVGKILDS